MYRKCKHDRYRRKEGSQKDRVCALHWGIIQRINPRRNNLAHTTLKTTINSGNISAAIGRFVALGSEFVERGAREITERYISSVAPHLEGAMSWQLY